MMNDKSSKRFWDRIARFYAPLMEKDASFYRDICGKIRPHLTKDMDVLELACGSGQLSFRLAKFVQSWLGTDFSEKMIAAATKRGSQEGLSFEVADATRLLFDDDVFDCVVIANALHIMPDPGKALQEIHRVLKPCGILCAPTFLWTAGRPRKLLKKLMSLIGFTMYQEWNDEEFQSFVEHYGFSVIEMQIQPGSPVPVGILIATKN